MLVAEYRIWGRGGVDVGRERTGGGESSLRVFSKRIPHYLGVVTIAIFLYLLSTPKELLGSFENGCAQS